MGGPSDLSGYDMASFSGDRGWSARAELQRPLEWPRRRTAGAAQYYVFAARGETVNLMPTTIEQRTSIGSSIGVGVRSSLGRLGSWLGPIELAGEFARRLSPAPSGLPDQWRVNFLASMNF
jgi:hemolysin activation/secretion protein